MKHEIFESALSQGLDQTENAIKIISAVGLVNEIIPQIEEIVHNLTIDRYKYSMQLSTYENRESENFFVYRFDIQSTNLQRIAYRYGFRLDFSLIPRDVRYFIFFPIYEYIIIEHFNFIRHSLEDVTRTRTLVRYHSKTQDRSFQYTCKPDLHKITKGRSYTISIWSALPIINPFIYSPDDLNNIVRSARHTELKKSNSLSNDKSIENSSSRESINRESIEDEDTTILSVRIPISHRLHIHIEPKKEGYRNMNYRIFDADGNKLKTTSYRIPYQESSKTKSTDSMIVSDSRIESYYRIRTVEESYLRYRKYRIYIQLFSLYNRYLKSTIDNIIYKLLSILIILQSAIHQHVHSLRRCLGIEIFAI